MNNCKCKDQLRITRGNDFTIAVEVHHPAVKTVEDFDLKSCTDIECALVSRLGVHKAMNYTINDSGKLIVDFDENVPLGVYGFEVTGKTADGKDWRFYAKPGEWLEIVNASSDESDPDANEKSYYEKDVTFGVVTAAGDMLETMQATMTAFTDAENERAKAEAERVTAETKRNEAEAKREEAESSREETFSESQAQREKAFNEAEDSRTKSFTEAEGSRDKQVSDAVKSAQTATHNANEAAENAKTATADAKTATDNAVSATEEAKTATADAKEATTAATEAADRANKAVDSVENKIKETVTISLSCNHDEDISGKKVWIKKADDDTILEELVWKGSMLETSVAPDTAYYVEAEAIEGCSTPKTDKFTAVSGNVRELNLAWQSEWFYPTVQMEDGTDCDGTGAVMSYDYGNERVSMNYHKDMVIKVPSGRRYQLVVDTKDGYYAGLFKSRVAGEDEYRQTVVYRPMSTNIGIQMTDGSIVAADDWDDTKYSADNVNGILLYTSTTKLVILCVENESRVFGLQGILADGCDKQGDKNKIVGCLGETNTEALIKRISTDDTTAAFHCHSIIFKSGRRGYLPAMDELVSIHDNAAAINACSQKIIGKDIWNSSYNYWSSTQYADANVAWFWSAANGAGINYRSNRYYVIPVSAL